MTTYRTAQGDTWDIVALKVYPDLGGEKLMHKLIEANSKYRETVVFPAGAILEIPGVTIPGAPRLPPWKRS
jgi:phage tail protein X